MVKVGIGLVSLQLVISPGSVLQYGDFMGV